MLLVVVWFATWFDVFVDCGVLLLFSYCVGRAVYCLVVICVYFVCLWFSVFCLLLLCWFCWFTLVVIGYIRLGLCGLVVGCCLFDVVCLFLLLLWMCVCFVCCLLLILVLVVHIVGFDLLFQGFGYFVLLSCLWCVTLLACGVDIYDLIVLRYIGSLFVLFLFMFIVWLWVLLLLLLCFCCLVFAWCLVFWGLIACFCAFRFAALFLAFANSDLCLVCLFVWLICCLFGLLCWVVYYSFHVCLCLMLDYFVV